MIVEKEQLSHKEDAKEEIRSDPKSFFSRKLPSLTKVCLFLVKYVSMTIIK